MDLSVIIPTYNRQELLRYTLDSVAADRHPGITCEVIVVDDRSTDQTRELVLSEYPGVRLLENKGEGAAAARNTGLHAAAGKYILYLDSDDIVGEGALVEKVRFLDKYSDCDACYGDYEFFRGMAGFSYDDIIFKHKYEIAEKGGSVNGHLLNYLSGNYLPPNAIVWRKSFLAKINGHDVSLLINQDVDLFIRALLAGLKPGYVHDSPKVFVRDHQTDTRVGAANSVAKSRQMLELRKIFYKRLQDTGNTHKEYLEALSFNVFTEWRRQRDMKSSVAPEFLQFSKSLYWPVSMDGSGFFRLLAKMLGPDSAVRMKYFLFKRNF